MSLRAGTAAPRSRLLVVDDQPLNVQALYHLFADEHQILMATNGEKALQVCREAQPDLVLLDVMMPGMDGYTVLEHLQADPATAQIPVVFVTARGSAEDEERGLALGAVDFIEKPIKPQVVRQRVRLHLLLRSREAELRHLNESLEATVVQRTAALREQAIELARTVRDLSTKTTVLDKAPFAILLLAIEGGEPDIVYANEATHAQLGRAAAECIGQHPRSLFAPDNDAEVLQRVDEALLGRGTVTCDLWGRPVNGRPRRLRCLVFPTFSVDGTLLNTVAVLDDITEVYEAREERERLAGELQESMKLQSLGLVIAGMAHDLNTPIGIAVTASSHMQQQTDQLMHGVQQLGLPDEAAESLREGVTKLARSAELVSRNLGKAAQLVRGFKQTSADATHSEWRLTNLHMLLDSLLVTLSPVLKRAHCQSSLDCPVQLSLYTEPGSLGQAITNLVVNATLHAFEGRTDRQVSLRAYEHEGSLCVEVADNGNGMTPEASMQAFTPFHTTRRSAGGSGLGLYSSRRVVEQVLGGQISFETEPGQGTRFLICVPRRSPADGPYPGGAATA